MEDSPASTPLQEYFDTNVETESELLHDFLSQVSEDSDALFFGLRVRFYTLKLDRFLSGPESTNLNRFHVQHTAGFLDLCQPFLPELASIIERRFRICAIHCQAPETHGFLLDLVKSCLKLPFRHDLLTYLILIHGYCKREAEFYITASTLQAGTTLDDSDVLRPDISSRRPLSHLLPEAPNLEDWISRSANWQGFLISPFRRNNQDSFDLEEDQASGRPTDALHLWAHFTISQDQTTASGYNERILATILSTEEQYEREGSESGDSHERSESSDNDEGVTSRGLREPAPPLETVQRVALYRKGDLDQRGNGEAGMAPKPDGKADPALIRVSKGDEDCDLRARVALLERENSTLKSSHAKSTRYETLHFIPASRPGIVHRATRAAPPPVPSRPGAPSQPPPSVSTTAHLDEPTWVIGPGGQAVLRCNLPVTDVNSFLRQRSDIAFVVSHYYTSDNQAEVQKAFRVNEMPPRPIATAETITVHSQVAKEAIEEFFALQPNFSKEFRDFDVDRPIPSPYLFWYHYRSPTALDGLCPASKDVMQLLTSWIEEHYSKKYDAASRQLSRSVISQETMPFLVKPGDVLVWEEKRKFHAGVALEWLNQTCRPTIPHAYKDRDRNWTSPGTKAEKISSNWSLRLWQFHFDGEFYRQERRIEMKLEYEEPDEEVSVNSLAKYPLQFAPSTVKACLEKRGQTFWKCRNQQLVSYEGEGAASGNVERLMVDYKTYIQLHPLKKTVKHDAEDDEGNERLNSEIMARDMPPPAPDLYVFPNSIPGYNLHSKKWVDLEIDSIKDVSWNKEAFKHLVVDSETKELVQALVEHQIASEQSTDIVSRKGNGLIILLHGGPGTGKTFTAESVAEMAEKPLFRVTCGDIGTKPEEVEKYLDSVLHLGKVWDCIVLIDEAEVFLEQRSLDNLERNALVSVFLRVLEYYEGILILTSNRVGTFDEAFKSRILLSLHYENLTEGQRTQIWKNFLRRLKDKSEENNHHNSSRSSSSSSSIDGNSKEVEESDIGSGTTETGSRKRKALEGPGPRKRQTREAPPGRAAAVMTGIDFFEVECYVTELAKHELNGRQIRNVITTARQLASSRGELMRYSHLQHVIKVSSKFDTYLNKVKEGFSDDQIARGDGVR